MALISLNEGRMPVGGRLKAAVAAALAGLPGQLEGLGAVVVLRQEAHEDNTEQWDEAVKAHGLGHKAVEAIHALELHLGVYTKAEEPLQPKGPGELQGGCTFAVASRDDCSPKGIVAAVVEHQGFRICCGAVHLDGNQTDSERYAPVPAVVARAREVCAGLSCTLDAVLLAGDVNATMVPAQASQEASAACRLASEMLGGQLAIAMECGKEKGTFKLSPELEALLKEGLATAGGRTELTLMDGCPSAFELGEGPVSQLRVAPLPPGSFPTYRLCNFQGETFKHLTAAAAALGAKPLEEEGIVALQPCLEVTPECTHGMYFEDSGKGNSGAVARFVRALR